MVAFFLCDIHVEVDFSVTGGIMYTVFDGFFVYTRYDVGLKQSVHNLPAVQNLTT